MQNSHLLCTTNVLVSSAFAIVSVKKLRKYSKKDCKLHYYENINLAYITKSFNSIGCFRKRKYVIPNWLYLLTKYLVIKFTYHIMGIISKKFYNMNISKVEANNDKITIKKF